MSLLKELTAKILSKMPKMNKSRKKFIIHLFSLLMGLRGRGNFTHMARQSSYNESSFRNNYSKDFDFLHFNQLLVDDHCSKNKILVFDPSFIKKSGKHTNGLSYFWSGSDKRAKKGLEIGGFACIDLQANTAMHLVAHQTPAIKGSKKEKGLYMKHYMNLLEKNAKQLIKSSRTLVVDGFFSKSSYVHKAQDLGFAVISVLRKDAVMHYPPILPKVKKRGRPQEYGIKVNPLDPDPRYFTFLFQDEQERVFQGKVRVKSLKQYVHILIVHQLNEQKRTKSHKIYFCTDDSVSGLAILKAYKMRFQIEFLYRDAKQFAGLQDSQTRDAKRLHFHFNASLTLVSLAKALHFFEQGETTLKSFSFSSIRTQYVNELLLDRFFQTFERASKNYKNNPLFIKLLSFGAIAA